MTVNHNKETLTLWKEPKLYSGSRYVVDQSHLQSGITDYDAWLTQNSKVPNETPLELSVYRQTITEPMKITENLPIMDEYTYGKLTNGDNPSKAYYIFIDRVTTDQYGTSTIEYSIDWWGTEWFNITCTKAHLTRKHIRPHYMPQPFTSMLDTVETFDFEPDFHSKSYVFIATYIPSFAGVQSYITPVILEGWSHNFTLVQNGQWYQELGLPGSDIKDCFVVPCYDITDFTTPNIESFYIIDTNDDVADIANELLRKYNISQVEDIDHRIINTQTGSVWAVVGQTISVVETLDEILDSVVSIRILGNYNQSLGEYTTCIMGGRGIYNFIPDKTINVSFNSTEQQKQGVMDWNGTLIWECPFDYTVSSFDLKLLCGISHIMLQFTPHSSDGIRPYDLLTGKGFCYDCRHPGIFVDSYTEYVLKNREYDIQMRKIQSDKELYKSVASTFENVGFGMAFGDAMGAKAAGIGSVINTIGTFMINSIFDPKIQEQYNLRYERMTDQISLVGDSITNVQVMANIGLLRKYTLTMDSASSTRMNNDISINGYYCDEITSNLQSLFYRGRILQADNVTVEGAVQLECRYQVVNRLMNGVEFI